MAKKQLSAALGIEAGCILFRLNTKTAELMALAREAGLPQTFTQGRSAGLWLEEWRAFVHAVVTAGLMQYAPNSVLLGYLRQTGPLLAAADSDVWPAPEQKPMSAPEQRTRSEAAPATAPEPAAKKDPAAGLEKTAPAGQACANTTAATVDTAAQAAMQAAFVDGPFAAYMALLAHGEQAACPALMARRLCAGCKDPVEIALPVQARLAATMALVISAVWDKLEAYDILCQ